MPPVCSPVAVSLEIGLQFLILPSSSVASGKGSRPSDFDRFLRSSVMVAIPRQRRRQHGNPQGEFQFKNQEGQRVAPFNLRLSSEGD